MTSKIILSLLFSWIAITGFSCKNASGKTLENSIEIEISEAKTLLNKDVVFLDVRTPDEIAEGKIQNSININFNDASFEQSVLQLDKQKEYIVYCRSGGRSGKAVTFMHENGFTKAKNLIGGYSTWNK